MNGLWRWISPIFMLILSKSIGLLVGSITLNHLHAEFLPPFGVNVQCNGLKPLML